MKKIALLLSMLLFLSLGTESIICAQGQGSQQSMYVTANNNDSLYKKELNKNAKQVVSYIDNITIADIRQYIATEEEIRLVENEGKIFTLVTTIEPKKYAEETAKYPEIAKNNSNFKYVMSLDISLSKRISNDIGGLSVISENAITELAKPVEIELETAAFDKTKKNVSKCKMIRIHNELAEEIPVAYNKKTGIFTFFSDRFSDYLLYFTLKDITDPAPTATPTLKPTAKPTPEPTKNPTIVPTPSPETVSTQDIQPRTPDKLDSPKKPSWLTPTPSVEKEQQEEVNIVPKTGEPVVRYPEEIDEKDAKLSNDSNTKKETKPLSEPSNSIRDVNDLKRHNVKLIFMIVVPPLLLLLILLLIYIWYKNRQLKKKLEEENETDTEESDDFDGSNEKKIDDFDI